MSDELQKAMLAEALRREQQRRQSGGKVTQEEQAESGYGTGLARAVGQGLSFGFGDEIEAFLKKGDGTYEDKLAEIRSAMAQFAEQNPNTALGAELIGSVPTALLGGAGLARAGVTGAAKVAGLEGALYGFGAGEGGAAERAKSAAVGGTVGAAVGKGSDLLFPKVSDAARQLMKKGVRLTPAQRVGGTARAIEEKAKSIPFVGEIITSAEAQALKDFNRASMNNVLRMLGERKSLPKNLSGNEAYEFINDAVSNAYDEVVPKMSVEFDDKFEKSLVKIVRDSKGLGADGLAKFQGKLESILGKAGSKQVSGNALRTMDADLGSEASNFMRSSVASERDLGLALFNVQRLLRDTMKAKDADVMREYSRAQAAFKQMLPVRSAVSKSSIHGGTFTPSKLLAGSRVADKSKDKIATAKGKAPQQEFGQMAAEILGPTVPNSGTADRAALLVALNEARQRPLSALGYGLGASAATGLAYRTPMGRAVTSGILQAPRAAGTTLAPAAGGLLAGPTIENAQRMFGTE
jgi:hypothetical protein